MDYLRTVRRVRDNVLAFQSGILNRDAVMRRGPGCELTLRYRPLKRVGVCIPGGAAAYPSSLLMTVVPAQAAGVAGTGATMGRPTCAVIPEAINSTHTAASFGCVGNRVYTGAGETDAYFAIPGALLGVVEQKLSTILHANEELEKFHRGRAAAASAI